jgi:Uma2 family endonuclease
MPTEVPRIFVEMRYEEAARQYLRKLPLEHFMEATPQATQREITLESLALVRARRPDVHVFNELLVQYPLPRKKKPGQVVPDNMIVLHSEPIKADGSFNLPLQPVGPFLVLEYVSKSNKRKDYDDNMRKYEHELKVPYYLLFVPDEQELTLYRHTGERYASVPPNEHGRHAITQLDLEVGLLDRWVRYWFRGELLPLPADLLAQVEETARALRQEREHRQEAERQRDEAQRQRDEEEQARRRAEAELAQLRARLAALERPPTEGP